MRQRQDHINDGNRALGAQGDMCLLDLVEIVSQVTDFFHDVGPQDRAHLEIAAFEGDLHTSFAGFVMDGRHSCAMPDASCRRVNGPGTPSAWPWCDLKNSKAASASARSTTSASM